jgi:hypothetical protein
MVYYLLTNEPNPALGDNVKLDELTGSNVFVDISYIAKKRSLVKPTSSYFFFLEVPGCGLFTEV